VSVDRTDAVAKLLQHLGPFLEGVAADLNPPPLLKAFTATVIVHCRNLLGTREIDVRTQLHFFT
jgi:TRAP-type uncharacterized transport system fused permease subunit